METFMRKMGFSLFAILLATTLGFGAAQAQTCSVPGTHGTIQAAVAAGAGVCDTITLAEGPYSVGTTIVLNRPLTISGPANRGAVLTGTSPLLSVFEITSSGVTLENLTVTLDASTPRASQPTTPYGEELATSLIRVPTGPALSGIVIRNNTLHVPAQPGAMSLWGHRAITIGSNATSGISITGNTIHNTRNGVVIQTGNTATVSGNNIYGTKGGIMNYTASQADADNRTMTGNLWLVHNEWDIVWNTAYYTPNYATSVLPLSQANNGAFVLDRRAAPDAAAANALTGNRSHAFVDAASAFNAAHPARGNYNEPFQTIALGIEAVVPGGEVYVAKGTYTGGISVNKPLTLTGDPGDDTRGPGADAPAIDGGALPGTGFRLAGGVSDVTIQGFEIRNFIPQLPGDFADGIAAREGSTRRITIRDNDFHNLGHNALTAASDLNVDPALRGAQTDWRINNNTFSVSGRNGIELGNASGTTIEGNAIALTTPQYSAILSRTGGEANGLTIRNNEITGTASDTYPVIYIHTDENQASAALETVRIEGNTIAATGTPYQVYLRNMGTGTITDVRVNSNSLISLRNGTSSAVDATCNWWGDISGPGISSTVGDVTVIPWLTSAGSACPVSVPGAPTSVWAVAGDASATVSFGAPAQTGGGEIIHYTVISSAPDSITVTGPASPITVTGLTNGRAYNFKVTATNSMGTGPAVKSNTVVPKEQIPPTFPAGIWAEAGNASATVHFSRPWTPAGTTIEKYRITRNNDGSTVEMMSTGADKEKYTWTGLTNGTAYSFKVRAINSAGVSSVDSPSSNSVTPSLPTPTFPAGVWAEAGNGSATVHFSRPWTPAGTTITNYTIMISPNPPSGDNWYNMTATGAEKEKYTWSGLTNGTAYSFRVRATNSQYGVSVNSPASNSVTPSAPTPVYPAGIWAEAGNASATVHFSRPWTPAGTTIEKYRITRNNDGSTVEMTSTGADKEKYTWTGLTNGTAYSFKVRAINSAGVSSVDSPSSNSVTPSAPTPTFPAGVWAEAGNGSATVHFSRPWTPAGTTITNYTIMISPNPPSGDNWYNMTATGAEKEKYTWSGLTNGTAYKFTVRAVNSAWGVSADSPSSNSITPSAPTPVYPAGIWAKAGDENATVHFSKPWTPAGTTIESYTITVTPAPLSGPRTVTIAPSGADKEQYTWEDLTNGVSYTFTARATNSAGISSPDSPSSLPVIPAVPMP